MKSNTFLAHIPLSPAAIFSFSFPNEIKSVKVWVRFLEGSRLTKFNYTIRQKHTLNLDTLAKGK